MQPHFEGPGSSCVLLVVSLLSQSLLVEGEGGGGGVNAL